MRKRKTKKRPVEPDIQYDNVAIARFVNYLMKDGKKSVAQKVVYDALAELGKKTEKDPLEVFTTALENVSPMYEVVSRRVGGANYQVPREVRPERRFFLACRWIIDGSASGKGRGMAQKLSEELLAAYNNEGQAIKKKQNVHKMAESNRAFAHFAR